MLHRSIIIEGMDGMGKSTLANKLQSIYECGLFTIGAPPSSDNVAEHMADTQIFIMKHKPIIFDRVTPISRLCYEQDLSEAHQERLFDMMDEMQDYAHIIWCDTAEPTHEIKPHDSAEHLARIAEQRDLIARNYKIIMGMIPHTLYDLKNTTVREVLKCCQ